MTPGNDWFPPTLQARSAWFHQFTLTMLNIGTTLGFSAVDLDQLRADDDWLMFFAGISHAVERFKQSVDEYCKAVTEGEPGESLPRFSREMVMPPTRSVPTPGLYRRLDAMVKRIQDSPRYTQELGLLLQIEPQARRAVHMDIVDMHKT